MCSTASRAVPLGEVVGLPCLGHLHETASVLKVLLWVAIALALANVGLAVVL